MPIVAHEPAGFDGTVVTVEVDIRRGIPAMDLIGLAEGAVREARERVRAAARNSGFEVPADRILVSLAPASFPKEGPGYDLPIALAILLEAGQVPRPVRPVLALGELRLDGQVRPVRGVLAAVAAGLEGGIEDFVVPVANLAEAAMLRRGRVFGISALAEATAILGRVAAGSPPPGVEGGTSPAWDPVLPEVAPPDLADLKGQPRLKRALALAAAGGHHLLLFGPPGSGKTMAARRLPSLLPDLGDAEALEVTRLHSMAGLYGAEGRILRRPPFRAPHHSSSREGLVGGGRGLRPGEASLAHRGVLFIDEAPEFHRDALQALREPLEEGSLVIVRAGRSLVFPAAFQLVVAANPCPCGNLGREGRVCACSLPEIQRYWRRLGGPLLDRIDLRVPLRPADPRDLLGPSDESSGDLLPRIMAARERQAARSGAGFLNARMSPADVARQCPLGHGAARALSGASKKLGLSSRACHSILRLARTIADLDERSELSEEALLEAIQHRRYADGDFYWPLET